MDDPTRDSVLVVRLWTEAHDRRVRGRVIQEGGGADVVRVGVDEIVSSVEAAVRDFEDADATEARRDE